MKNLQYFVLCCLFLTLASCRSYIYKVNTEPKSTSMEADLPTDAAIEEMIAPYKAQLDEEMNTIIGSTKKILTKTKPESDLGNFMADAILAEAKEAGYDADFALVNYGGIRIPALPAGDLTRGKVFELMPFDNVLVRLELDGKTLEAVFQKMAAHGGWPVSKGVSYSFTEQGELRAVSIDGEPIDPSKRYQLVLSDFIANGGDNMAMFKGLEQENLGVLFRDALLQYVERMTAKNQLIDGNIEGRSKIVK